MKYFDPISKWLGLTPTPNPQVQAMREALDAGRQAKLAEDYDTALAALTRGLTAARVIGEPAAVAVIALHQAEILIRLERWEDADHLLEGILKTARAENQQIQIAYTLAVYGTLAQEQNNWALARNFYEQALSTARQAHSAGSEGRALGHLADTYLREGNASYAVHLLRDALPLLNDSGDIELSSYFVGLLGQALLETGQEAEGYHLLNRALQLAEHIHYRYFERHWSLVIGNRAFFEGRYDEAHQRYARAMELFPPGANSSQYVNALSQMSRTFLSLRDFPQALEMARKAVEMSGEMDGETQAAAQGSLGMALRASGRSAEAAPALERAVAIYDELQDTRLDPMRMETMRNLAAAKAESGDPGAQAIYERAIAYAEKTRADLALAQLRRDLGLLHVMRGNLPAAIQAWTAALTIYEDRRLHAQVARLYTDLAGVRRTLGQTQRSLKDYERALMALNLLDEGDLETRGLVLSNAANAYADQGDVESADAFFNETITIAEKLNDRTGEATRRGNYGWFLITIGRPRRAIATLEQALRSSQALGATLQTAVQSDNLGLAYDSVSDYPIAISYHRQAFDLIRAVGDARWTAMIGANLAATLISLGQTTEAQILLDDSVGYGRANNDAEVFTRAAIGLSRLALMRGQPAIVDDLLAEALTMARRSDIRRLVAEVLAMRSEQQAALGQHAQASASWDEALKLFNILRMPQAKQQPAWLAS